MIFRTCYQPPRLYPPPRLRVSETQMVNPKSIFDYLTNALRNRMYSSKRSLARSDIITIISITIIMMISSNDMITMITIIIK